MSRLDVGGAVAGGGLGLLVAADGSPLWQCARVLAVAGCCIAVRRLARRYPRRRSLLATAGGVIATTVGATIAWSHLSTTGLSLVAVGAALCLAGGIVVLVSGTGGLVRAAHGWHRVLAIPAALLVAYVVVLPLGTAVYATNVPRPPLGTETPTERGLRSVDVRFRTTDGVTLSGWYLPSANRAAVVLLHGASSTRANVLDQAVVLVRHGYGVLLFDARGHGRSGGRAMELGWYGDEDVSAAVSALARRPEVDPRRIGAVGMSMGGEEVIGAMAADGRIRAAVAEGATNRVVGDKAWLATDFGLRGRVQQGVAWLTYALADLLTEARPPIALPAAVAAAAPRPVLLIAAGAVPDEARADRAIRAASPVSVSLWVVPDARHTGGLRRQPREWERRVIAFLDRHLRAAPGG